MPTIYFSEITWIEANRVSRLFACYWLTKLNTLRISFYWEEITSAPQSTEFMDFTTNVRGDITSNCGKPSQIASTASQLLLSLTRKSCACMVDSLQNLAALTKSKESWDLQMYLTLAYFVIFFGQIPTKMSKDGEKTTEVWVLLLVKKSYQLSPKSTILIWFAEPIRL
jgi:hypothetical protein